MSLTQHLGDRNSPIRRFFEDNFPGVSELKYANSDAPPVTTHGTLGTLTVTSLETFRPGASPVLPTDPDGYPWRDAGTAFDYRLRLELGPLDLATTTAFQGWDDKMRRPRGGRAADSGWTELVTAVDRFQHRLRAQGLEVAEERELARLCGALALYEQAYRMGGALNPKVGSLPIWQLPLAATLPELLALVDDRLPDDVAALTGLARDRVPGLTQPSAFTGSPSFARSRDLRGADGDLVADGMLVEVKCVQTPTLDRRYAWQLLGYLLADTDDQHAITSVGWYFARQGYLWSFPAEEFIARLAGRPVRIQDARADFTQVCAAIAPSPRPPAPPALGSVQRPVRLYPPTSTRGKWHITAEDVPWIAHGTYPPDDLNSPACGTSVTLNLDAEPLTPQVGTPQARASAHACRRCLLYSEQFFTNRPE